MVVLQTASSLCVAESCSSRRYTEALHCMMNFVKILSNRIIL